MKRRAMSSDLATQACLYFDLDAEKSFPLLRRNVARVQQCRQGDSRSECVTKPSNPESGFNYIYIEMLPTKSDDKTLDRGEAGNDDALTQKLEVPLQLGQRPQTILIKSIPGYRARLVPLPALNATMDAFNRQSESAQQKTSDVDYTFYLGDATKTISVSRFVCFLCPAGDFDDYESLFMHLTTRHCNFDIRRRQSNSEAGHVNAGIVVKALPPLRGIGNFAKFAKQEGNFQFKCARSLQFPAQTMRTTSRARRIMSKFERVSDADHLGFGCTAVHKFPTSKQPTNIQFRDTPGPIMDTSTAVLQLKSNGSTRQVTYLQENNVPTGTPTRSGQFHRPIPLSPQVSAPLASSKASSQNRLMRSVPTCTLLRAKHIPSTGKSRSSLSSLPAQTRHLPNAVHRTATGPELVQGRQKFHVPAAPGDSRFYFRNVSKRLLEEGELLSESDDDVDQEWVFQKHRDRIRSSSQLSAEQKEFLCRYDVHMLRADLQGMRYVPAEIQRFIKGNRQWLESPTMRAELTDKIHWLQQEGTISAWSMVECLKTLQSETPNKSTKNAPGLTKAVTTSNDAVSNKGENSGLAV